MLTHCHSDHIFGIIDLLKNCTQAEFYLSSILALRSFRSIVELSNSEQIELSGVSQIRKLNKYLEESKRKPIPAFINTNIYSKNSIEIEVLSPTIELNDYFDSEYRQIFKENCEIKDDNISLRKVNLSDKFNLHSVVLALNFKDETQILLTGDIEYYNNIGFEAIVKNINEKTQKYRIFKIPHHGSSTSYNEEDWNSILDENPLLLLTTWNKGQFLPTLDMAEKILSHSNLSFITSNPFKGYDDQKKRRKNKIQKFGLGSKIRMYDNKYGAIKVLYQDNEWSIDPQNGASPLLDIIPK